MKKRSLAILLAGLLAFNTMPINGIAATAVMEKTTITREDFEDEDLWYSIVDACEDITDEDMEYDDEIDVSAVERIKHLSVDGEEIESLKGLENLTSLEVLDCGSNDIKKIEKTDLPASLVELYCGWNGMTEIEALPEGLEILSCNYNMLSELPALPSTLKELRCGSNVLETLPELPSGLQVLYCEFNYLKNLPKLPGSLTRLGCEGNKLTKIELNPNAKYEEIDVTDNYLRDTSMITGQELSWDSSFQNEEFWFEPQREHDYDITTIKEPTCTETGLDKYVCKDCGKESIEVTSELGHVVRWRNMKAATCTENGYSGDYLCIHCNTVFTAGHSTEKLAHTGVWFLVKEATVNYEGMEEQRCASCGTVLATRTIPATGKYTVKYVLNGGTNNAKNPVKYNKGKKITLKKATKAGYTFKGWYTDKKCKKKATAISKKSKSNMTFYAKWEKVNYKITYQLNKGKNNKKNPKSYTVTSKKITFKNPTRKGYKFMGWYSDKKMTKKVTNISKGSTGKVTLYAKWAKK